MPPHGGVVLGTAPREGKDAALNALFVDVSEQRVDVTDRNVVIASVPRDQVGVAGSASASRSPRRGRHVRHLRRADRSRRQAQLRSGFADPNLRPQIVGVFTDLTGPAPPGLTLSATIDTRFSTTPTTLKLAAMVRRDPGDHRRAASRCGAWTSWTAAGCAG